MPYFYGYCLDDSGRIASAKTATTFSEAQLRLKTLSARLTELNVHPLVMKFCNEQFLQGDYFHAIFEASKGVVNRIQQLSGIQKDGNSLVSTVFSDKQPILVIKGNMLATETDRDIYSGLRNLLRTVIFLYRNPKAHTPKIYDPPVSMMLSKRLLSCPQHRQCLIQLLMSETSSSLVATRRPNTAIPRMLTWNVAFGFLFVVLD